jgi:hypothetical protein
MSIYIQTYVEIGHCRTRTSNLYTYKHTYVHLAVYVQYMILVT